MNKCQLMRSVINAKELVVWRCVSLRVLYCFDIPEANGISVVRYGVAAQR